MSQVTARLGRDARGVAMVEFALALPLVLATTCYGVEIANYALANLRVSQVALALADNASRVGITASSSSQQLREIDILDVLEAARAQGKQLGVTTNGRITLSSLEPDASNTQRIHWQRCLGLKEGATFKSHYGDTPITAGSDTGTAYQGDPAPDGGMGPKDKKVVAPPSSGVMFVEVNYQYQPVFGTWMLGDRARVIHYIASFIVRDRRDFSRIWNPSPGDVKTADKLTCNRYTA